MTPEEEFIVDLEEYLVIKNVLTVGEVVELNRIIDRGERQGKPSLWDDPFKKLIDHPKILPYLLELLGAYVRLDHDYAIFMDQGTSRGGLHGGPDIVGDHWYKCRDGTIRNGLSVVTYAQQMLMKAMVVLLAFREALIHGTKPWTASHERRSLLYKYSSGHSAWCLNYYDLESYGGLTEQQQRMLLPPSIGNRPKVDADL